MRRVDRLQLDAADADAPLAGGLVEHDAQLAVDLVAAGERLFEVEPTDDVAQRGRGQLLDGAQVVADLVRRGAGVGHLEVDDRVDRDDEVVLGDDGLRRERDDLLAHVDERAHAIDERHQDVQPGHEGLVVPAEALDDARRRLRDDPDRADDHDQHEDEDGEREQPADRRRDEALGGHAVGSSSLRVGRTAVAPSMRLTRITGAGLEFAAVIRAGGPDVAVGELHLPAVRGRPSRAPGRCRPTSAATLVGVGSSPRRSRLQQRWAQDEEEHGGDHGGDDDLQPDRSAEQVRRRGRRPRRC